METLLISACLVGYNCKYNGGNNALPPEVLAALRERYRLIPVCPEAAGGLPTPRVPSERRGGRVVTRDGRDVTAAFRRGAEIAGKLAERTGARLALLKSGSPSCGSGMIYDGSFTGTLMPGDGVTAEYLKNKNLIIFGNYSSLLT
ncbi:MAG: DUF523 domain-containing protein [Oscillospiraceae bacterium]|nr:DUF523 domain-containing protein [Oscillospiraceae bacterium]